jgi:beta-lactam-binding protein with PASTA domain
MLQRSNTEYQSGLVITTSPYAGDIVPSGYTVDLLVSDGSPGCQGPSCYYRLKYVTMPYVIGQTVPQVTTALALDSITLGTSAVEASSEPAGTVICTDPEPDTSFPDTEKVNIGVSSGDPGSPPVTVCVPSTGPPTSSTAPPPISRVQPSVSP